MTNSSKAMRQCPQLTQAQRASELDAYNKARATANSQWMKVIALDWDGDGYREVTEWVGAGDAMLGIDLDGDGVIGNSRELFNGAATALDQRGWGSLKYYDSNKDNKIDRSDAVFKLLRLWKDTAYKNPIVAVEQHDGKRRKGCQMRCKSALKAGAARVVRCGNLHGARVADFREMAM